MKNATMRRSGTKMMTVPAQHHLSLIELRDAYLVEITSARDTAELDELGKKPAPGKREIMETATLTLWRYGNDFSYRMEEFPDDFANHPMVVALTKHINNLFKFEG